MAKLLFSLALSVFIWRRGDGMKELPGERRKFLVRCLFQPAKDPESLLMWGFLFSRGANWP